MTSSTSRAASCTSLRGSMIGPSSIWGSKRESSSDSCFVVCRIWPRQEGNSFKPQTRTFQFLSSTRRISIGSTSWTTPWPLGVNFAITVEAAANAGLPTFASSWRPMRPSKGSPSSSGVAQATTSKHAKAWSLSGSPFAAFRLPNANSTSSCKTPGLPLRSALRGPNAEAAEANFSIASFCALVSCFCSSSSLGPFTPLRSTPVPRRVT
mmetsp:Transcript_119068/g.348649  ORF Transcript_119068/g.348649 Transcript_119068/m.348649 type:complete len:209 (-) Transcript_119068:70-696(-)